MRAHQEDQSVPNNRGRHRAITAAGHVPDLLTGLQIVTAHVFPAIDDQLGPRPFGAYVRRAPGGRVIARRAPDFLSIDNIECRDKSIGQHIALHEHSVAVNDR